MKNNSTYFIFANKDVIDNIINNISNSIDEVIQEIEEENYSYTLYEFNPEISNPAIILFEFINSGFDDYSTLTKEEFNKLKELV
jgi:hypothetical protein